jgi:hypothetical protein
MKWQGEFSVEKHSLADWVRLKGGIAPSAITRDAGEIRHYCSRKEAGYNLINQNGETLDGLTYDAIAEGWLPDYATHDDFLSVLGSDIQAKRKGELLCRAWHPSRDWDDLIEESRRVYHEWGGCEGCGNPEASVVLLSADGAEEWYEVNCDPCVDMLEGVM